MMGCVLVCCFSWLLIWVDSVLLVIRFGLVLCWKMGSWLVLNRFMFGSNCLVMLFILIGWIGCCMFLIFLFSVVMLVVICNWLCICVIWKWFRVSMFWCMKLFLSVVVLGWKILYLLLMLVNLVKILNLVMFWLIIVSVVIGWCLMFWG